MTRPAPWRPVAGRMQMLEPGLTCVMADNPSPYTGPGTNSYLIGDRDKVLIDPGPDDPAHRAALLEALPQGGSIAQIIVTHPHLDHSDGTAALAKLTGAPVLAFGGATAGRSAAMALLALGGDLSGGEGIDAGFAPDRLLADGETVETAAGLIAALWTPGHCASHLSLAWNGVLFCGDLVMGWAPSLISPPDGDLSAYRASLARLAARRDRRYYSGHGAPIADPAGRIAELLAHRQRREAQVIAALGADFAPQEALTRTAYADTPLHLHDAAGRNLLAHLIDLTARGIAEPDRPIGTKARFRRL